jgi:hypothetical protein
MAVYLATALPLPEADRAPLRVEPAAEETARKLRRHLTLPHVYFVASHEGCGCGFVLDHGDGTDEDCAERQASALALRDLAGELPARGAAEILVCLDGLEDTPPEHTRTLGEDDELEVRLNDRVLYRVAARAR